METEVKEMIWHQFGAAIDMMADTMRKCPEGLWYDQGQYQVFWYTAYHTLFWLDFYLTGKVEGFAPPPPFGLEEMDPAGVLPPRPYTKEELLGYLDHCRAKCRDTVLNLSDEEPRPAYPFRWGEMSFAELLLYNMRHVHEHGGQLSLMLGQAAGIEAKWFSRAQG